MRKGTNSVTDPTASDQAKATHPLSSAEIRIHENDETPNYYRAELRLSPHFQLEGVNIPLLLELRLHAMKWN